MTAWHIRALEKLPGLLYVGPRETTLDLFMCGIDWPRTANGRIFTDLDHAREGVPEIRYVVMSRRAMRGGQRERKHVTCSACLAALDRFRETGRLPSTK